MIKLESKEQRDKAQKITSNKRKKVASFTGYNVTKQETCLVYYKLVPSQKNQQTSKKNELV